MAVDLEGDLRALALQIDRLKILYEQYFIGAESTVPVVPRRKAEKLLAHLASQTIGNTGVRFRYVGLLRRWKTYSERWDNVLREIENGTYAPHVARSKRKQRAAAQTEAAAPQSPEAGVTGATGLTVRAREDVAPPVPGMSTAELEALHRRYVDALREAGDGRTVKFDGLVAALKKQVPDILQKNQWTELTFNIAVKDGRVILRASPKR